ncbi:MAG: hypothetical protein KAJ51_13265 [Thermoplasmata archaeon]|jgi:hypothetical protein|nr:hypothetical protein [Thermoplasmata archaeon]
MEHLKKSWEKLERLNPPPVFKDDSEKPIEGVLQQLIIELEIHLHRIYDEIEYLAYEVDKLREK